MTGKRANPALTAKSRSLRKIAANFVLVVASLVIGLVVSEWTIRLFLPVYDPSGNIVFKQNAAGVTLGIPNFTGRQWKNTGDYNVPVAINRYGFRDHKDLRQSTPHDIFVVGDSFAFGQGVREEKRFSNLLQQKLKIPVYNIGIPGDLQDYELLVNYARKNGARIKLLVVSVCMENDLIDYDKQKVHKKSEDQWQLNLAYIKHLLTYKSATYNMLTSIIQQNDNFRKLAIKLGLSKGNALMGAENNVYDHHILTSSLSQLQKVIKGTDAVILIVPSRGLWIGDNIKVEQKIHHDFVALLKEAHLPLVDMKPILEAGGNPLQYHFKHDGHWNESGHAQAAAALARYFKQNIFNSILPSSR